MLETNLSSQFSKKVVYNIWLEYSSQKWKCYEDEFQSVQMLIEEARKGVNDISGLYIVESIPLHQENGFTAIAFCLPAILYQ